MQAWLTRKFEHHGRRYLIGCAIGVGLEVTLIVAPIIAFFPAHYEGLSIDQYLGVLAACGVIAPFLLAGIVVAGRRRFASLLAWADDRSAEHRDDARRAAFEGPRQVGVGLFMLGSLASPILLYLLARPHHHTTVTDYVELAGGALLSIVLGAINVWFILDILMRPVRAAFPGASMEARRTSLVTRLAIGIPVVVWISTFAVSYLTTTRARAGAGHLLVVYAVGAGCVLFSLGVTAPMFVGAVMSPIRDLARGTSEVASGRLGTRVPVTSTDELGQLATSFNHMVDELQASRARVVAAGDTARRQVERDLHDGAQQRLVLIRLKLNLLKRDPTRLDLIDELTSELDQALAELRDLARGLYPARLESDGLPGALADVAERAPIPTAIESNGTGRMPPQVEAAVYFCCLEALQNAAKHAGPSATARISVTTTGSTLSFEIADDGAGFDPATARAGGSGLQNMSDRVGALGGNVRVDSAPGGGTKVVGTIPIPDATRG